MNRTFRSAPDQGKQRFRQRGTVNTLHAVHLLPDGEPELVMQMEGFADQPPVIIRMKRMFRGEQRNVTLFQRETAMIHGDFRAPFFDQEQTRKRRIRMMECPGLRKPAERGGKKLAEEPELPLLRGNVESKRPVSPKQNLRRILHQVILFHGNLLFPGR